MISQNNATEPERKDECKFTQPFQLRIDFQKQLKVKVHLDSATSF